MEEVNLLCKYREPQLDLLSTYIQPHLDIYVPSLILEGPPSSGKSHTLNNFIHNYINKLYPDRVEYLYLNCEPCVFERVVFQRLLRLLINLFELNYSDLQDTVTSCDNASSFIEITKQLIKLHQRTKKKEGQQLKQMIIVLDKIDKVQIGFNESIKDITYTLSKLYEQNSLILNKFTFIYCVNRWDLLDSITFQTPSIIFPCYKLDQLKDILMNKFADPKWLEKIEEDLSKTSITMSQFHGFKDQFISLVIDVFNDLFGSDLTMVIPTLTKTWPLFYKPLIEHGKLEKGKTDIFTLFRSNRDILKTEYGISTNFNLVDETKDGNITNTYDLSSRTKYVLVASYLASFNEIKHDLLHFTKEKTLRSQRKFRIGKRRKSHKGELGIKLLLPQPFNLERLIAIFKAIYDQNVNLDGHGENNPTDLQLLSELATLASLKLVVKLSVGDTIGGTTKWRCNLNWDIIHKFCQDLNFEIQNYIDEEP